ncbi:olfactory receptor 13G1-like [Acanthopagrus schlegelii]
MVNIVIIVYDKKLHKPMFLLICNLAVADILCTTSVSPTMIGTLLAGVNTISYVPCVVEMYTHHVGGVMEMFALAVMAFDRLIAVSCPFQYHSYLTNVRTILLEKRKMGSTCLSHLIVVVCFYLPMFMRIVLSRMGVPLTAEQRHGLSVWSYIGPPSRVQVEEASSLGKDER